MMKRTMNIKTYSVASCHSYAKAESEWKDQDLNVLFFFTVLGRTLSLRLPLQRNKIEVGFCV